MEVGGEEVTMSAKREKRWIPLTNGTIGWVREHDPETESGIVPMTDREEETDD